MLTSALFSYAPTFEAMARKRDTTDGHSIGERVRALRSAKGLTQIELGRRLGLSSRMMAYYEVQGGSPSPELLSKIAKVLDVSIETVLGIGDPTAGATEAISTGELRLWRRFKRVQELPVHDRKAVLKMIEAMANEAVKRKTSTA